MLHAVSKWWYFTLLFFTFLYFTLPSAVSKWWYLAISVVGALLFGAYLVYDIQVRSGRRRRERR